jgi:hypothetical protein
MIERDEKLKSGTVTLEQHPYTNEINIKLETNENDSILEDLASIEGNREYQRTLE